MPFTLAHPAAILPVRRYARRYTSLSALVLGSMMPDLGYFFSLHVPGSLTHSITGIFAFCLPAGLLAYVLFHAVLRRPLMTLTPAAISSRLDVTHEWLPKTAGSLAAIVASIAIGAATHIGWDAFTHANTAIVRHSEFLRGLVGQAEGPHVPAYKLLQYFSGVFGLAVLAVCIARWIRTTPPAADAGPASSRRYRLVVIGAILSAGAAGGAVKAMSWHGERFERVAFGAITGGMAAMMAAILLFCVCWHVWAFVTDAQNRSNSPR